jgi:hypothetical protein
MSLTDGQSWWEENAGTRRLVAICSLVALALAVLLFHSDIKDFLQSHSWSESVLAGLPELALGVLAYFELRHSGEANQLRREANDFRAAANRLQGRVAELEEEKTSHLGQIAHLEEERNEHLKQIAANTQRPMTQAERNGAVLRKYLGKSVIVTEGNGGWGSPPEIVEVADDTLTLFSPRNYSSSQAWYVKVHLNDVEITETPHASCTLQLRVIKRYGPNVSLGEITRWEDRFQQAANPSFAKGGCVCHAEFTKPGSPERRSLYVYASRDGANSFLLEASTGEKIIANNVEISKRFAVLEVDYGAAGFIHGGSGKSGGSPYPIFIR